MMDIDEIKRNLHRATVREFKQYIAFLLATIQQLEEEINAKRE